MANDLSALIARLEAAEVGSRELDLAIMAALGFKDVSDPRDSITCWRGADGLAHYDNHVVTSSLDAALALAERVHGEARALDLLQDVMALNEADGLAIRDLPRLLCIAILRAKQGEG